MPALGDYFCQETLILIDDVHLRAALESDAALPVHGIGRPAIVETGKRAFVRFRPARAESGVVCERFLLGPCGNRVNREYANCGNRANVETANAHQRLS